MSSSSSTQVRAAHILIKHEGSRKKSSWRDPEGHRISATKRDSAAAQLKAIRDDILAEEITFDDAADYFSDCHSAMHGGDVGEFGRGEMQRAFEDVAFSLKVGEISGVVHTASGSHIIMRTG